MVLETENGNQNTPKNQLHGWSETSLKVRLILALVALPFWAVILASWHITPSADGYGSHTQLGIAKCSWIVEKGRPCPTCGMTTAYSLVARGRLIRAFIIQPAGCVFAICHLFLTFLLTTIAISGKYPVYLATMANYHAYRILFMIVLITLAGWGWTWARFSGKI